MDFIRVAWKSGLSAAECRHLEQVGKNAIFPEEYQFLPFAPQDLSSLGTYRMLTDERIKQCQELKAKTDTKKVRCFVAVQESSRFTHFSIYDVNYYSRFGRVVVTADVERGTLDCRCCRRKRRCIHKCICLWYFNQQDMVDVFRATYSKREEKDDSDGESFSLDGPSNENLYPPNNPGILATMCRYLREQKRIPMYRLNTNRSPTSKLVPKQSSCHFCSLPLSAPITISQKAMILTMKDIFESVETYYKRCEACGVCYRYQETALGILNYNDTFLIGLDVCSFLRDCLQQHIPIGSIVKVLQSRLKTRLNAQDVVNAYLPFDSMSEHDYNFFCILCGYYPVITPQG